MHKIADRFFILAPENKLELRGKHRNDAALNTPRQHRDQDAETRTPAAGAGEGKDA
jgi:hypothetical protein